MYDAMKPKLKMSDLVDRNTTQTKGEKPGILQSVDRLEEAVSRLDIALHGMVAGIEVQAVPKQSNNKFEIAKGRIDDMVTIISNIAEELSNI